MYGNRDPQRQGFRLSRGSAALCFPVCRIPVFIRGYCRNAGSVTLHQSLRQAALPGEFAVESHFFACEESRGYFFRCLHIEDSAVILFREHVYGKPVMKICRRRYHRLCVENLRGLHRQIVGASKMSRKKRNHIFSALVDHQDRRIGFLALHIRRDAPHRNPACADKNDPVVRRKPAPCPGTDALLYGTFQIFAFLCEGYRIPLFIQSLFQLFRRMKARKAETDHGYFQFVCLHIFVSRNRYSFRIIQTLCGIP